MDPLGLFGRPNRDADPALHLLMESRDWSLCCAIRQIKFHEMHFCARNNVIYSSPISSSLARWPRKSSRPASDRVRSRRGSAWPGSSFTWLSRRARTNGGQSPSWQAQMSIRAQMETSDAQRSTEVTPSSAHDAQRSPSLY